MQSIRDMALVLKREHHLDNDAKLVLFLRKTGKIFAVAKSVRKNTSRLKSIVEPFVEAEVQVMLPEHKVHGRLISGVLINSHHSIRSHFSSFTVASRCAEVVLELIPNRVPTEEVYDILRSTFQALNHHANPESLWITFVSRLLHQLGHGDLSADLKGKTMDQCLSIVQRALENQLQKRLKSEVLNFP